MLHQIHMAFLIFLFCLSVSVSMMVMMTMMMMMMMIKRTIKMLFHVSMAFLIVFFVRGALQVCRHLHGQIPRTPRPATAAWALQQRGGGSGGVGSW